MPAFQDISGMRFGRLVAVERAENKWDRTCWRFRCDCGNETIATANHVKRGLIKSCGCLSREVVSSRNYKHGMSWNPDGTRPGEYAAWRSMINRCENPNFTFFEYYGGRGIEVYRPWRESFECFFQHLGPKPSPQNSIDRKNNDYGYFPGNVRWATREEQANNKRPRRSKAALALAA
jgi:hypothetical protein